MQKTPYESLHQPLDWRGAVARDEAEAGDDSASLLSKLLEDLGARASSSGLAGTIGV